MDDENIIGPRLRALRDRLGLSQRALARKAGVPSSTVSLVESGRTSPSVGSLKRLLDAAHPLSAGRRLFRVQSGIGSLG